MGIFKHLGVVLWVATTALSAQAADLDNTLKVAPNSMTTIWVENRSTISIRASIAAVATADSINNLHEPGKYGVCNWRGGRCAAWTIPNGGNWTCSNYSTCQGTFTLAPGEKRAVSYGSLLDMTRPHFGFQALNQNVSGAGATITASGAADDEAVLRLSVESLNDYTDQKTTQSKDIVLPKMAISTVTPSRGWLDGGDAVVISGRGFQPGATVLIGGVPGRNVSVKSPTSISVLTPPRAIGVVPVEVLNTDGTSAKSSQGFSYLGAPQISYSVTTIVRPMEVLTLGAPTNVGGTVSAYSITPPLPPGLRLNVQTGFIRGRPDSPLPLTAYTVTATNKYGSSSATLSIQVLERIFLQAAPGNRKVFLDWNQISGVSSYNLYWSKSFPIDIATAHKITNVTAPFTHQGADLVNDQAYYYLVKPVASQTGNEVEVRNTQGPHSSGATPALIISLPEDTLSFTGIRGDIFKIVAWGPHVYVSTTFGLAISKDGGRTFRTTRMYGSLAVAGPNVYMASSNKVLVSYDHGISFKPFMPDWSGLKLNEFSESVPTVVHDTASSVDIVYWGGIDQYTLTRSSFCPGSKCKPIQAVFKNVKGSDSQSIPTGMMAVSGANVYAASRSECGLFVSRNGGDSYTQLGRSEGLNGCYVTSVVASGTNVYVGTDKGLSVSRDGGNTFLSVTAPDDVKSNPISGLALSGSILYIGTGVGLYVSPDGGASFAKLTTNEAVRSQKVTSIAVSGQNVYVSTTAKGRALFHASEDGGITFRTVAPLELWPTLSGEPVGSTPNAIYPAWRDLAVTKEAGKPTYRGVPQPYPIRQYPQDDNIACLAFPEYTVYCADGSMFTSIDKGKTFYRLGRLGRVGSTIYFKVVDSSNLHSYPPLRLGDERWKDIEKTFVTTDGARTFRVMNFGEIDGDYYDKSTRSHFVGSIDGSERRLFAAGYSDSIGISDDGGISFRSVTVAYSENPVQSPVLVTDVAVSGANVYAWGWPYRPELYLSTDEGNTFKTVKLSSSPKLIDLVGPYVYLTLGDYRFAVAKIGSTQFSYFQPKLNGKLIYPDYIRFEGTTAFTNSGGGLVVSVDGGRNFTQLSSRYMMGPTLVGGRLVGSDNFNWYVDRNSWVGMAP